MVYSPPVPIATIVSAIAARESHDIVKNIQALDGIASTRAPIKTTMRLGKALRMGFRGDVHQDMSVSDKIRENMRVPSA